MLKIDAWVAAKHKIILSWPYRIFFSIKDFLQRTAAYFIQKFDFGALAVFENYSFASTWWKELKFNQQSDGFRIPDFKKQPTEVFYKKRCS